MNTWNNHLHKTKEDQSLSKTFSEKHWYTWLNNTLSYVEAEKARFITKLSKFALYVYLHARLSTRNMLFWLIHQAGSISSSLSYLCMHYEVVASDYICYVDKYMIFFINVLPKYCIMLLLTKHYTSYNIK